MYDYLDQDQKRKLLVVLATKYYVEASVLNKALSQRVSDFESIVKIVNDLRKFIEPKYLWIFQRLATLKGGHEMISDIKVETLNMVLQCKELSSFQNLAVKEMYDYLKCIEITTNAASCNGSEIDENEIGEPIPFRNNRVVINNTLFLQRPIAFGKLKTPVCDFVYQEKGGARFYTGFGEKQRKALWDFLGPDKYKLQVWGRKPGFLNSQIRDLSVECQFLLCLLILRRNKSFEECYLLFGVSDTVISELFKTWLGFIRAKFKDMEDYCTVKLKDLPRPPPAFRNKYLRKIRFSIDCTEFRCQSTKNYREQGNNWSDYKKNTTKKVLIAVSPSGSLQRISPVAQGSMSDREIFKKSGFNELLDPGDEVLADRGFNIEDLTLLRGAKTKIPPFLNKRKKFTYQELVRSKLITRARIHVERFNQRLKLYKYISDPIPNYKLEVIDDAIFVCAMLVNFTKMFAK